MWLSYLSQEWEIHAFIVPINWERSKRGDKPNDIKIKLQSAEAYCYDEIN
ncbi:hypothetical protein J8TS2_02480 [Lederbergia ruris]|uniref:Uncharacterized protein n=1 Tax=Lederbergia ruris TaxID=217495 RepID=A0ABQ4KFQ2_9BACI|nr:hypothetical protein J8TS2_02480 [Lederbergia ruris]